jgi:hypothetical protein
VAFKHIAEIPVTGLRWTSEDAEEAYIYNKNSTFYYSIAVFPEC